MHEQWERGGKERLSRRFPAEYEAQSMWGWIPPPQQHHDWSGNQELDTQPTVPLRCPKVFVLLRKINPNPVSQKNQTNKNMEKTVFAMVTKNAYLAALNYHFTHTKTKSLIKFQCCSEIAGIPLLAALNFV